MKYCFPVLLIYLSIACSPRANEALKKYGLKTSLVNIHIIKELEYPAGDTCYSDEIIITFDNEFYSAVKVLILKSMDSPRSFFALVASKDTLRLNANVEQLVIQPHTTDSLSFRLENTDGNPCAFPKTYYKSFVDRITREEFRLIYDGERINGSSIGILSGIRYNEIDKTKRK